MTDRPILFSAPMVRALLSGTKTQTRRAVKGLHPDCHTARCDNGIDWKFDDKFGRLTQAVRCRYGQPGDRLWVRETHVIVGPGDIGYGYRTPDQIARFRATEPDLITRWSPSIHMPRWASRITLEVTGVRVERLQDISEADAIAEGVNVHSDHHGKPRTSIYSPVEAYHDLWESINGPGSWALDPWVWCVSFNRVTP